MAGIFISYRRDDAQGEALHLFDNLKEHFGADRVFMDVIAIRPGEDFRKVIDGAVASCDVLITLIGKEWLQRLTGTRDFVRLETAAALKRDVRVIPVLVQGATMPTEEALPDELKPLAYRNAIELSHSRWDYDVRVLIEALERVLPATAPASTPVAPATPTARRPLPKMAAVGAAVALLLGGAGYWFWPRSDTPPKPAPVVVAESTAPPPAPSKPEPPPTTPAPAPAPPKVRSPEPPKVTSTKPVTPTKPAEPKPVEPAEKSPRIAPEVPAPDLRSVPDLIGKSTRDVSQTLQQADLKWVFRREATDEAKANAVIRQQPAPGTQVKPGTTVEVTVAVPATVEAPKAVPDLRTVVDLVGKSAREASDLLQKADLRATWVREATDQVAAGMVIRQDPAAGARVSPGSEVTVTISTAASVEVPRLIGLTRSEAADRLKRAGLEYKWATTPSRQQTGTIVAQNPEGGVRLRRGSAVLVTVAASPEPSTSGRCIDGYVWREAVAGDRVCVTPETRTQAAADNQQAGRRIEPDPGKRHYGPDTCRQGYVWREASPTDHVCVVPATRTRAAEDNRQAASRVAR
jgi:beta-lactam-binding protein with PASTA domain